jgi:hypothetical protein
MDMRGTGVREDRVAAAATSTLTSADMRRRWIYVMALVVLNAADLVTTHFVLAAGGQETNPLMAPIIDGWLVPVLAKAMALLAVALCVAAKPAKTRLVDWALVICTGWYGGVVLWNMVVIAVLH